MAFFSEETNEIASGFLIYLHDTISDSINLFWYHITVWGCMIVGTAYMALFGTIGIQTWWMQYSAANPGVMLTHTVQYWVYTVSSILLQIALVLQSLLVAGILYVLFVRRTSLGKLKVADPFTINPVCPKCSSNYRVIKKGMRNGSRRYQCKQCGKYFTKHGDY